MKVIISFIHQLVLCMFPRTITK